MEVELVDVRNDESFIRIISVQVGVNERLEIDEFTDNLFSGIQTLSNDDGKISKEGSLSLNLSLVFS